jgi:transcriptional regulator of arginine metabolism
LIKVLSESGKYRYAALREHDTMLSDRLVKVFSESVLSIDSAGNIIVLKTFSGAAGGACEAIDTFDIQEIVGTIAGDDTIFVLIRSSDTVEHVMDKFKKLMR